MYQKYDYRNLVVGVNNSIPLSNGEFTTAINFDNAATTPPLIAVMKAINDFSPWYSSIHRGTGYKSQYCSEIYDKSRELIASFVNADPNFHSIVYVKNTTEAINKLSYRLHRPYKDSIILCTEMEHHSNDLPWRNKYKVDYISVDINGNLSLADLENKLYRYKGKVKLVSVAGASNVTGFINPIHTIASIVHKYKSRLLVDGAQLVPHKKVDMKPKNSKEHIDFLVFSAHKMYAPFGTGVLISPKDDLESGTPEYSGGGTVDIVTRDYVKWAHPPEREEAGTPNVMGVVALTESIKVLKELGMENIEEYEQSLLDYAFHKLQSIPNLIIYGRCEKNTNKVSIIAFNIKGMYHLTVATILSHEYGIAVRNGCFCAHPYVTKLLDISKKEIKNFTRHPNLPRPGLVRISLGLYNTYDEIDILANALNYISKHITEYNKKYREFK